MSIDPAIFRALVAQGATPEMLLAVVEADAAVQADKQAKRRADTAARVRKYRSKPGNNGNALHSVTVNEPPSLEVSPQTPLPNPNLSNSPLTPRAGGRSGAKSLLPKDWVVPTIAELPPKARACAEQWTRASYETHAEAFVSYWHGEGKMKTDWRGTWANRVIALHSQVMRDQRFGNAPVEAKPAGKPVADTGAYLASIGDKPWMRGRENELPLARSAGPPRSIGQLTAGIVSQAA